MSVVGAVFFQSKRGKASEHDVTDDISESRPTGPVRLDIGNPDRKVWTTDRT